MLKGAIRKAIFGNKRTTVPAAVAALALSYGVAENPEQATAMGAMVAALAALVLGQLLSKDGDK